MEAKLQELKARLVEAYDLNMVSALLNWDQSTYMPAGGAPARGRQMGLVAQLAHEKMTDPGIGKLLDELRSYEEGLPYDSDDASLIRVARREYERDTKVPSAFMAKLQAHWAESYDLWTRARPANDFKMVQGALEKTLDLSRELANYFPGYEHIADPLINLADYGMKASDVRAVFTQLRDKLVPIVQEIT
ncbi:MAG TPA: carboxypeptidase M32, partial [Anaerolineae bacterium]